VTTTTAARRKSPAREHTRIRTSARTFSYTAPSTATATPSPTFTCWPSTTRWPATSPCWTGLRPNGPVPGRVLDIGHPTRVPPRPPHWGRPATAAL